MLYDGTIFHPQILLWLYSNFANKFYYNKYKKNYFVALIPSKETRINDRYYFYISFVPNNPLYPFTPLPALKLIFSENNLKMWTPCREGE